MKGKKHPRPLAEFKCSFPCRCSFARQPRPGCALLRTCPLPGQRFPARAAPSKGV